MSTDTTKPYLLPVTTSLKETNRRIVNRVIADFVDIITTNEPAYTVEDWYTMYLNLKQLILFGTLNAQQTLGNQCVLVQLPGTSSTCELYKQLISIIPHLKDYANVSYKNSITIQEFNTNGLREVINVTIIVVGDVEETVEDAGDTERDNEETEVSEDNGLKDLPIIEEHNKNETVLEAAQKEKEGDKEESKDDEIQILTPEQEAAKAGFVGAAISPGGVPNPWAKGSPQTSMAVTETETASLKPQSAKGKGTP